ncbi:hypothetical protein GUJ93_ZPchr0013g34647 [Zizania palustris]|uniref:Uncharacterized protein n=1 Tax=Zizania palustris TaxID=103762 RepID=A0A8J6BUC7_ZIZPA|nr:hypothetical protein GUJ93_ZPchr0013g34647 [Zizania palustris]
MGSRGFVLEGRVFVGDLRTFPGHREVLAFLHAFAEVLDVAVHVRLHAELRRVRPLGLGRGGSWSGATTQRSSTSSWSATTTALFPWCRSFEVIWQCHYHS